MVETARSTSEEVEDLKRKLRAARIATKHQRDQRGKLAWLVNHVERLLKEGDVARALKILEQRRQHVDSEGGYPHARG